MMERVCMKKKALFLVLVLAMMSSLTIWAVDVETGTGTTESEGVITAVPQQDPIGYFLFSTHPQSQTVAHGEMAQFSAVISGNLIGFIGIPTEWQYSTDGGSTWNFVSQYPQQFIPGVPDMTNPAIVGTETRELHTKNFGVGAASHVYVSGNQFRAVAWNGSEIIVSNAATLTITSQAEPIVFTTHPQSQTVTHGQNATFTFEMEGYPIHELFWQYSDDNGTTWRIGGNLATHVRTFQVSATTNISGRQFRVQVWGGAHTIPTHSNAATLTVTPSQETTDPARFTTHPQSQTVLEGTDVTFFAQVTGHITGGIRWEFSEDGGNTWRGVNAQHPNALDVRAAMGRSGWQFRAVVTAYDGTIVRSNIAILTVTPQSVMPPPTPPPVRPPDVQPIPPQTTPPTPTPRPPAQRPSAQPTPTPETIQNDAPPAQEPTLPAPPPPIPGINTASNWARSDIANAVNAGLVPLNLQSQYTQATTRAEFAALAVALYETVTGIEIAGRIQFNDTADINVQKMGYLGVVMGVGNDNFAPNDHLTREQAATLIARLANVIGQPLAPSVSTFADNSNISSWAFDAVGQMQASGIMGGVGNNQFSPSGDFTREQSIITMLRLFDILQ